MRPPGFLAALTFLIIPAGIAHADPCRAIPDHGPVPAYLQPGKSFSGPVVRVLDGDSMCVALGDSPSQWVEVRLVDFYAAELGSSGGPAAKAALETVALGKVTECKAGPQSYDRVVSACRIGGRAVGDLMRAKGVPEGGRGFERARDTQPRIVSPAARRMATAEESSSQQPFRNCAAARAAGAAPLHRGDPGYAPWLDRDGDGIACEPYRGH
jgi:endonuclease YncB( thermonuclease family)